MALADAGADVVCASSKPDGADDTADAIRALGRQAWTSMQISPIAMTYIV